jgi:hypothetical protein
MKVLEGPRGDDAGKMAGRFSANSGRHTMTVKILAAKHDIFKRRGRRIDLCRKRFTPRSADKTP